MTPKQKAFCRQFVIHFNGAQAAIAAGYSKTSAKEIAYQNLQKPEIREFVHELQEEYADSCHVTKERVIAKLAEIGFDDENGDQIKALGMLTRHFEKEPAEDEDSYEIVHVFEFPHNGRDEPFETDTKLNAED